MLLEILQRKRHGWVIERTVKWPIQQLMGRRHKRKLEVLGEKLQTNIYICELEQGSLLGDNNDEMNTGSILTNDTIDCSEEHHEEMKRDSSVKPHVFKSNHWCVDVGYVVEQQIDMEMKQVADELENDGPNVNMRDVVAKLKFLEEWLDNPNLEHDTK